MGNDKNTIVILGAGYGGLTSALRLASLFKYNNSVEICLIDKNPFHTYKTQLHEAAVRNVTVSIPIENIIKKTKIRFIQGEVVSISPERRTLKLKSSDISFDYLVIALGSITNYYNIEGLKDYSLTLQSLDDAQAIFEHINGVCEEARLSNNYNHQRDLLRFVVGGGGLTGVEFAAELVDFLKKTQNPMGFEVIVIEGGSRLVPSLEEDLSKQIHERLEKKGVTILTNRFITKRTADTVLLSTGETIRSYTLIWTGGIRISDIFQSSGLKTGLMGRIVVNEYLQALDYPYIFALGDNALAMNPSTNKPVPTAAQFALQQGRVVAENVYRLITRQPLISYKPKILGEVVSLGKHLAVGWLALPFINKLKFIGFLGSLIKAAIEDKHILLLKKESRNWIGWQG
ncbi:MAG: NAD(P)/FAD-dependent oxidoreductase [Thermodesulfovibrionales bacterium]|nr:NAD(P)/FAD-dependent oxidoreductase [Thermodesulfovibrionales bacterium]